MNLDFHTVVLLVGAAISALLQTLKFIQNPDIDDQDKMAVVAGLSLIGGVALIGIQHLVVAPGVTLTWNDGWNMAVTSVEVLLGTQLYHVGVNKLLDAIVTGVQSKSEGIQKKTSLIVGPNG